MTNPLSAFTYSYAPHTSMLTGVSLPDGGDTLFTYKGAEQDLRLETIENLSPSAAALSKFHYAQDAIGRITDWVQQEAAGTPARNCVMRKIT